MGGMFLTDSKEDAGNVHKWSTQSHEVFEGFPGGE